MAYQFAADEPVHSAILRCGRDQLDKAVAELSDGIDDDPVGAVHNARKSIKKERSLLRLARGAMPSKQLSRENEALRQAARRLSDTRDAEVLIAALDGLAERFVGQVSATTFDVVRAELEARRARSDGAATGSALGSQAVQELAAIRLRIDDWEVHEDGWKALDAGLRRSFKRGRRAFKRARRSPSAEDLHALRKRVKDLWYHQRLLAPACGPAVRGQAKDAHHVSDLLGDDHDLVLLRAALTEDTFSAPADVEAVIKLLEHRRGELQTDALRTGERVYAESPKAFARRMKRSWEAGRSVAHRPYEEDPAGLAATTR